MGAHCRGRSDPRAKQQGCQQVHRGPVAWSQRYQRCSWTLGRCKSSQVLNVWLLVIVLWHSEVVSEFVNLPACQCVGLTVFIGTVTRINCSVSFIYWLFEFSGGWVGEGGGERIYSCVASFFFLFCAFCLFLQLPWYVSLVGAARGLIFVATNMCLSQHYTTFVVTKVCLLWQNYVCRNKTFVATNTCLSWQKFRLNKHPFVMTKDMFCACSFVTTKLCLLRQNACCDKMFVATKRFSWQKWYLWQLLPMTDMMWKVNRMLKQKQNEMEKIK